MKKSKFESIIVSVVLATILFSPALALAQNYCTIGQGPIKVPCPITGSGPAGQKFFGNLAITIINIALLVVGSLAVLFLIIGGYRYITAHGNEEQTEGAKRTIKNSLVGIIIVVMSFAIITIIVNILVQGQP